MKQINMK